jgi:hypothetical protein
MGRPERFLALADDLIRNVSETDPKLAMRHLRRGKRVLIKALKVAVWMVASAIVIVVAMITAGLLFGPTGIEGVIAAPLAVLTAWATILYFAYRPRATPRRLARADLAELPARTEEWLDGERLKLPASAQPQLDAIMYRLEALGPQLYGLDPQLLEAMQIRQLIGEELPELVHGYQKVPRALQHRPLHDGPSPERRLVDALATIDEQIDRLQHRLAEGDLKTLATHQRYLEIKYKGDPQLK